MGPNTVTEILRGVLNWLILAILFGAIASWVWTIHNLLRRRPLLPETPLVERRKPPWGIGTILLILVTYVLVSRYAFEWYALATRGEQPKAQAEAPIRDEKKGGEAPGSARPEADRRGEGHQGQERAKPHEPGAEPAGRHAERESLPWGLSLTELMFVQAAINSILLVLLPGIARLTSGARLRDFGLCFRGWRRQAAVGVVAVLFLMPIVYTVQLACVRYLDVPDPEGRRHPVEKMLRENFSPGVAYLAFLTAVILAPLFEELLFRGAIQSWLVREFDRFARWFGPSSSDRNPARQTPVQAFTAGPAAVVNLGDSYHDRSSIDEGTEIACWDADDEVPKITEPEISASADGVSLEESPGSGDGGKPLAPSPESPYRPRSPAWTWTAIVLTSLFFAALHAPQWPAPIPLFLLSLGLGLVYQRTGSLIAPICMHALFNGFSTLGLLYMALEPPKDKPPGRPVLERVASLENGKANVLDVGPRPLRDKSGIHPGFF